MGLDQYIYKVNQEDVKINDDLLITECALPKEEIFYYRKFASLQGWMQKLYIWRGGINSFNGIPLLLTKEDIINFQNDFEKGLLPKTTGYFFGNDLDLSSTNVHEREWARNRYMYTQKFIKTSLELIDQNYVIVYDSSW